MGPTGGPRSGRFGWGIRPLPNSKSLVWYEYNKVEACGPSGGPVTPTNGWPNCAGEYQIGPGYGTATRNSSVVWAWGPPTGNVGVNPYYKPGFRLTRVNANSRQGTNTGVNPDPFKVVRHPVTLPSGWYAPGIGTTPVPFPTPIPYVVQPHLGSGPGYDRDVSYGEKPIIRHNPIPGTEPHTLQPPKTGEKERKVRVGRLAMWLLHRGHDVTEGLDFMDALWEALPKDIQISTPRTGKTKRGAKIGEGRAYHTPQDKLGAIYRHYHDMDVSLAVKNVLLNHFKDMIDGYVFKGSDKFSNDFLGGAREVFAGGGMSTAYEEVVQWLIDALEIDTKAKSPTG